MTTNNEDKEVCYKTSVTLSPYLVKRVQEKADELGISRSSMISVLINEGFKYEDSLKEVAEFNKNISTYVKDALEIYKNLGENKI